MPRFLERFAPESRRGILLYTLLLAFLACLAGAAALWVEPEPAAPAAPPAAGGESARPLPVARQAASAMDAFLAEQRGGLRDLAASDEARALLAAGAMSAAAADAGVDAPAPVADEPARETVEPISVPAPPALATADSAAAAPAGAARADTSAASAAAEAGAPPPITGEADRAGTAASGDGGSHAAALAGASEDLRARLDERFAARLGRQSPWSALVLLDGDGAVLAAAGSPALVQRLAGRVDLATAAARTTVLALPGDEGLVMAVPCASGDGPEGVLAGVLEAGRVLASAPRGGDERTLHLVAGGRTVAGKPAAWLAPLLTGGGLSADAEVDADGGRRRAARSAVGGSGLAVLLSLPGETSAAPSGIAGLVAGPVWRLPVLLAALAALVLLPLPALAGARRRSRDLAGRAREAERAQRDAQKKSEQLMAEVLALKKAEARQRLSEEHLRNFINALPLPVFEVDAQGRVRYVNTSAYATFGYEQEDVEKGLAIGTVIAEEEGERLAEEFAQALAGGEGEEFAHEFTARTKEGRQFPVLISSTPVFHEKQAVGLRGIVVDMSARARAEEALRRAKEDAESASRTKGEFLANVSHEIRTPLNGILGMTELALDTELSSQQREYLRLVKQSGESLLGIINDILDFSKIEAGKLSIDQSEFSLSDCLGGILKTLGVRADDKGLELLAQVPVSVPDALLGDCGRLRQVLVNLVGNAIKFTSEGEILVRAEVEAETDEDLRLHFLVRDTGIGIQPEKQDSIFRAFEQADGSTTRRHGGTGLGLAISSHLVSLMGGRLWVDSEVGVGSTFHFSASFGKIGLGLDRDEERLPQLRGLPLLVVDDNATSRQILAETLGGLGLKVDAVESGAEALAKLTSEKDEWLDARLVLVDSNMPGMSGFDLAKRLLEDLTLRAIPVLMLASAGRRRDAIRCHELDLPAYLTKPALPLDLLDVLFTALGELPVIKDGASGLASLQGQRGAKARRALRVLLVEDNLVNQRLAARLLEKWGHSVGVAENGEEALAALEREPWDLALMDVQMPKMDGYETTAAIRKREAATGEHLPVIALTAHAMQGDRERCLQAGMDAYVAKPIDPEELFAALEEQAAKLPKTTGAAGRGEDDDLDRYIEFVSSLEEEGPAGS